MIAASRCNPEVLKNPATIGISLKPASYSANVSATKD
jgi:hypothetical protein